MRTKISTKFPGQDFPSCNSEHIYIMDYTNQTKNQKGIEFSKIKPNDIDSFKVKNPIKIEITFCPFKENTIKLKEDKKELSHCEGILFPTTNNDKSWILFLELKYPKLKNLGKNLNEAKKQLFKTLAIFREQGIIEPKRLVYLIISAPKYTIRIPFNNFSMTATELKNIRKEMYAIVKGTNEIEILNNTKLKV
jgi:hypothetical protein